VKKRLKTNGIIIFAAFLLLIIFHKAFLRNSALTLPEILAAVSGLVLIIIGQMLRACARGYKADNSRQGKALIKGGPYALVRNPMYLGILLIGLGMVIALFKWWLAVVFICIFILRYITLMFTEEKKLNALFPGEYADYQKRVPRIIPSVVYLFQHNPREYFPLKVSWVKKEVGTMLAVLFATIIIWIWKCFW
jgi:protein-S-isoprenylcysteine O-methyltransferase Ste14